MFSMYCDLSTMKNNYVRWREENLGLYVLLWKDSIEEGWRFKLEQRLHLP